MLADSENVSKSLSGADVLDFLKKPYCGINIPDSPKFFLYLLVKKKLKINKFLSRQNDDKLKFYCNFGKKKDSIVSRIEQ